MNSEHTPLLGTPLPPLDLTVERVRILEITQLDPSDLCPQELATCTAATRTAYALLVLLLLRTSGVEKSGSTQNVWEEWSIEQRTSRDGQQIGLLIISIWTQFLEDGRRSSRDIEDILWLEFLAEGGGHRFLRVVDLLNDNASDALLSHRLVYLSLSRTWKCGRIMDGQSSMRRFDALCTPR